MKIIDILNKIANGEEPPKKIVYENCIYEYVDREEDYWDKNNIGLFDEYVISNILNDEVEILETTLSTKNMNITTKKIEKIIPTSLKEINNLDEKIEIAHIDTISAMDKINEIIDHLNNQ